MYRLVSITAATWEGGETHVLAFSNGANTYREGVKVTTEAIAASSAELDFEPYVEGLLEVLPSALMVEDKDCYRVLHLSEVDRVKLALLVEY